MEKKYNIDVYCLCWNEIKIIPFVIDYWKRFARHVYVYDNGSDDGSIELLESYDWITVRHFESEGINEMAYLDVKNNCWKGSDADWVVVCDMDECLYSKNLNEVLDLAERANINGISPKWTDVWSMEFPTYEENKLCHEICGGVIPDDRSILHKFIIFKPNNITDINFTVGCHSCQPKGSPSFVIMNDRLYLVHLKNLSPDYRIERFKTFAKRLSKFNLDRGFGNHYLMPEEQTRAEFNEKLNGDKKVMI